MKDILLKFLRQYSNFPDEVLAEVIDQLPFVSYTKGMVLLQQGEVPTKCYFILR